MSPPVACPVAPEVKPGGRSPAAPAMTRCECSGLDFADVARLVKEQGMSFEQVARRTGCGATCTACLPDLSRYLR